MAGAALARQPNPLPNPFRPGNGVPPPYLAGRDEVLTAFEDWLLEAPPLHANWALTGLRGTGKTVLLGEFAARAERAGWLTLHRELGDRHRDDARFAESVAEDCDALMGRVDAIAAVGQAIERGARWLRPKRIGIGELSLDPSYGPSALAPADVMRAALAELDATVSGLERPGVILLYDEGHLLADDRARERYPLSGLLAAFAAVQRERPRVRIILCGLPTLSLNLKRARTYAERMFRHVVLDNLALEAAAEAIAIPLAGTGRSFGLSLINQMVDHTAGYPYFLQFFGAFTCSRIGLEHIELADYERIESALLHELDLAFFEDRFLTASPAEQDVLLRMAGRLGDRLTAADLSAASQDVPNIRELLRRLVARGLLYRPTRGSYRFALPLFGGYLRRQRKVTNVTDPVTFDTAGSPARHGRDT
jgi:hypothetical protein